MSHFRALEKSLWEVVRVVELDPIQPVDDGEPFEFRIEIQRSQAGPRFRARVYRLETYRIPPAYSAGAENEAWDARFWVLDEHPRWVDLRAESAEKMLWKVKAAIANVFDLAHDP